MTSLHKERDTGGPKEYRSVTGRGRGRGRGVRVMKDGSPGSPGRCRRPAQALYKPGAFHNQRRVDTDGDKTKELSSREGTVRTKQDSGQADTDGETAKELSFQEETVRSGKELRKVCTRDNEKTEELQTLRSGQESRKNVPDCDKTGELPFREEVVKTRQYSMEVDTKRSGQHSRKVDKDNKKTAEELHSREQAQLQDSKNIDPDRDKAMEELPSHEQTVRSSRQDSSLLTKCSKQNYNTCKIGGSNNDAITGVGTCTLDQPCDIVKVPLQIYSTDKPEDHIELPDLSDICTGDIGDNSDTSTGFSTSTVLVSPSNGPEVPLLTYPTEESLITIESQDTELEVGLVSTEIKTSGDDIVHLAEDPTLLVCDENISSTITEASESDEMNGIIGGTGFVDESKSEVNEISRKSGSGSVDEYGTNDGTNDDTKLADGCGSIMGDKSETDGTRLVDVKETKVDVMSGDTNLVTESIDEMNDTKQDGSKSEVDEISIDTMLVNKSKMNAEVGDEESSKLLTVSERKLDEVDNGSKSMDRSEGTKHKSKRQSKKEAKMKKKEGKVKKKSKVTSNPNSKQEKDRKEFPQESENGQQHSSETKQVEVEGDLQGKVNGVKDEEQEEEEDWEMNWDERGECLNSEALVELGEIVDIQDMKLEKPKYDYLSFKPKDLILETGMYDHVVEMYDFSPDLKTPDLIHSLSKFKNQAYDVKWVDDTHALAVFSNHKTAQLAIEQCSSPMLKIRSLYDGSRQSKLKAKQNIDFLQPYKDRPKTSKLVANRLVAGALGVRSRMTKEERQLEREKIKAEREKKITQEKQKKDLWDSEELE